MKWFRVKGFQCQMSVDSMMAQAYKKLSCKNAILKSGDFICAVHIAKIL